MTTYDPSATAADVQTNFVHAWDWPNPPDCSCGYAGMHTWLGHLFRLRYWRRTW